MFQKATAAANAGPAPKPKQTADKTNAGASASQTQARRKKIMIISISVVAAVLLLAVGIGTYFYLDATKDDGLIYSNVYVQDINLGGLTPEEATGVLNTMVADTYQKQTLTIALPDGSLVLTPSSTDISLDVDKLVEDAYAYGRTGSRWERTQAKAAAALTSHKLDIMAYMTINTSYIQQLVQQVADTAASELVQTEILFEGEAPDLNRTFEEASKDETVEHMTMKVVMGTPYRNLDVNELVDRILDAYAANDYTTIQAEYVVIEPDALDVQALFQEHCIPPVDAILDEQTYDITPEVLGYGIDLVALENLIITMKPGESAELQCQFLDAEVTKAKLEANLFQDVLAEVHTDHVYNPNRTTNLTLAANAINGTIIRPGEVFSFNKIVGERTSEKGYKAAAVYAGEATVDQVGGGICQVASTIYYAALLSDLEIVERSEHRYLVEYVPPGMDATIYWGSLDFKFRNNTEYPIRIESSVSGGQVHVKLIGTDDPSYYIVMKYETVSGPHYGATKYEVHEPNNPDGYYDGQVIQTAYAGRTVKTYRCKYDSATDQQISSVLEATSTFQKRDKIICIIGDPTAPTDESGKPIETTTEPTTEPTTAPTEAPTTEPATEPTAAPTEPTAEPTTEPTEAETQPTEPSQSSDAGTDE